MNIEKRKAYKALVLAGGHMLALPEEPDEPDFSGICEVLLLLLIKALRDSEYTKQQVVETFGELADVVYKEEA